LDARNIRRFLRNMGVLLSKQELVALIRRIDLDGDAKISYEEFFEGVKSQFSQVNRIGHGIKAKGILSSQNGNTSTMVKSHSRSDILHSAGKAGKSSAITPLKKGAGLKIKIKRPLSAVKTNMRAAKL
jgi:EF-hand domain pair